MPLKQSGNIIARSAVFAIIYTAATVMIGALLNLADSIPTPAHQTPSFLLSITFTSGFLIGMTLGLIAKHIKISFKRALLVWTGILFFNMAAVIMEGYFFAPGLLDIKLVPKIILQYLLLALISSVLIFLLFPSRPEVVQNQERSHRSFISWTIRFLVSALSYMLFYFVFGALNFELFTKQYYQTHSGLAVPELETVLVAEAIRSVLIVLSIIPLLNTLHGSTKKQVLICGSVLFIIGGIVPLLLQIGSLPAILLVASGVEIFFQNFLTGTVTALMLGSGTTSRFQKPGQAIQPL